MFLYRYKSYDDVDCIITFTCKTCGSHDCIKILNPYGESNFWSGYFMCKACGTSICDNEPISCYSSCFHMRVIDKPVQLSLFD